MARILGAADTVRVQAWISRLRGEDLALAVLRALLLVTSTALIALSGGFPRLVGPVLAMAALSVVASLPFRLQRSPAGALIEAQLVTLIATIPDPASGNLMLCLLTPGLSAALRGGYGLVVMSLGSSALLGAVVILSSAGEFDAASLLDLFQWSVLSMGLGVVVVWYRRTQADNGSSARQYADAVRVLTELEGISRRLPTGLDVGSLALDSLTAAIHASHADRGVLVTIGDRGQFEAAASHPDSTAEWLPADVNWEDWSALASQGVTTHRVGGSRIVVMSPVQVSGRLIAYVLLEFPRWPSRHSLASLATVIEDGSIPLEAAVLFSRIRSRATVEERSRVAREIHDGIAQDIAFLGYTADEIVDTAEDEPTRDLALQLRNEITRVVGELRMSVFAFREGVPASETLGAALGRHARRIFQGSHAQLHLTIDESPRRLLPEVESEVLRIAQEALSNARRHSDAKNVWVSCVVDAPTADVLVQDDGGGMRPGRHDSFGLEIMQERAHRINGELSVYRPERGGTAVKISV